VILVLISFKVCHSPRYLKKYSVYLENYLKRPKRSSRLRDVEADMESYSFDIHTHTLYSFDVCGGCEAHAILMSMETDRSMSVSNALLLESLTEDQRRMNIALKNCPSTE
jgi:hypothetical protein